MKFLKTAVMNLLLGVLAIGIGVGAVVAYRWATAPGPVKIEGDYARLVNDVGHGKPIMVVLKGCPHCEDARVWLSQHRIDVQEVEIGTNPAVQTLLKQDGINSTPTLITRNLVTVGFYQQIWEKAFGVKDTRGN